MDRSGPGSKAEGHSEGSGAADRLAQARHRHVPPCPRHVRMHLRGPASSKSIRFQVGSSSWMPPFSQVATIPMWRSQCGDAGEIRAHAMRDCCSQCGIAVFYRPLVRRTCTRPRTSRCKRASSPLSARCAFARMLLPSFYGLIVISTFTRRFVPRRRGDASTAGSDAPPADESNVGATARQYLIVERSANTAASLIAAPGTAEFGSGIWPPGCMM